MLHVTFAQSTVPHGELAVTRRCLRFSTFLLFSLFLAGNLRAFCEGPPSYHSTVVRLPVVEANDLDFTRISFGQGPSHGRVQSIVQDRQGFLWFGTNSGLERYDGYRFREFRHDPNDPGSLSGSAVHAIVEDKSGKLWVGSDQFLDRYDPSTEAFTHYPVNFYGSDMMAWYGLVDRQGTIWVATSEGLYKIDPFTGKSVRYQSHPGDPSSLSSNHITTTLETRDGKFWVATRNEVAIFNRATGKVVRHFPIPAFNISSNRFTTLLEDHAGMVWIGSEDGLAALDPRTNQIVQYSLAGSGMERSPLKGIRAILEDENGNLWLGTANQGILKLDRDRKQVFQYRNDPTNPQSLSSNQVVTLCEDREGNIWVGTTGGGVNSFSSRPLPFMRYWHERGNPNSLDSDYTSAVYEDSQGALWVGSMAALTRIDGRSGQYAFYRKIGGDENLSSTWVLSIVEDRDGYLWFGTLNGGLDRFERRTGQFKIYRHNPADPHSLSDDTVYGLTIDRNGVLWASTADGFDELDAKTGEFRVYRVPGDPLTRYKEVVEDPTGALWLGTWDRGLYRFDPGTGHFTIYRNSNQPGSLSSNRVNSICIDRTGTLWVGTDNGLDRFVPTTHTFVAYSEKDGLSNAAVSSIQEDRHGNLWLSTGNGLSQFDPRAKSFRNYYTSDGLLGNEFYNYAGSYKSPVGEMFFNSYAGLIAFFPDKLLAAERPYVPAVVITGFQLFGKPVPIGGKSPLKQAISFADSLILSHAQSIFSFEFAALSYANPGGNRYRYRLEGLENEWNETDSQHRSATYTTLPAGNYIFQVQGRTDRGEWSQPGASIRIRILSPWWRTWWFLVTCAVILVAVISSAHRLRVHALEERHAVLEQHQGEIRALNEQLIKAQEAERMRIAGELHDGVLQQITSLSLRLAKVRYQVPPDSEATATVNGVQQQIIQIGTDIRHISHELHPALLQESGLPAALTAYCNEFSKVRGLAVSCDADASVQELSPGAALCLYRIAQEALGNAAKYSEARKVDVRLTRSNGAVCLSVSDDGIGCTPDVLRRSGGLGVINMRERVLQLDGTFEFDSQPGRGTTVKVEVPFRPAP